MIEFALAVPCFLIVVAGILYFGLVLYQNVTLSEGAQAGLRQLIVSRGQTTDPCALVSNTLHNYAPSLNQTNLTYTLTLNGTSYNGTSCTAASTNLVLGASVQVYVTYPARLVLYSDVVSAGFLLKAQEQDKVQ